MRRPLCVQGVFLCWPSKAMLAQERSRDIRGEGGGHVRGERSVNLIAYFAIDAFDEAKEAEEQCRAFRRGRRSQAIGAVAPHELRHFWLHAKAGRSLSDLSLAAKPDSFSRA